MIESFTDRYSQDHMDVVNSLGQCDKMGTGLSYAIHPLLLQRHLERLHGGRRHLLQARHPVLPYDSGQDSQTAIFDHSM